MIWCIAYVAVAVVLIAVVCFACGYGGSDEPLPTMLVFAVSWGPLLILGAVLVPFVGLFWLGKWVKTCSRRRSSKA